MPSARRRVIKFTNFMILFSVIVVIVLLGLIGNILYVKTKSIIDEKMQGIHAMKLNQTAADVRKQFEDAYQSLDSFRNSEWFSNHLSNLESGQLNAYERVKHSQELEKSLQNFRRANGFVEEVVALTEKGVYSSNLKYDPYFLDGNKMELGFTDHDQIVFAMPGDTYELFQVVREQSGEDLREALDELDRSPYFIGYFGGQAGDRLGLLLVKLNMEALQKKIPYADSIAIIGPNHEVLFRGEEIEEEDTRYTSREIGFNGLKLIFSEQMAGFHQEQIRLIARYSILALIGSLLLSYVFARMFGSKILHPLHSLVRWIRGYGRLKDRWNGQGSPAKRRTTMRERFFLYFLITILLPSIFFVSLFYIQSTRIITRELQETYYALFEKTAHRVSLFVEQKQSAMTWLAYDTGIGDFSVQPSVFTREEVDQLVFAKTISALSQDTVSIYSRNNELLYTNRYKQSPRVEGALFERMLQQRKRMFDWLPPMETGSSTISLSMSIFDVNESSDILGILKTDIDGIYFSSLYAELNAEGMDAFIVNEEGRVLSHPELEKIGQSIPLPRAPGQLDGFIGGSSYYFSIQIAGLPWYLVAVNDMSVVKDQALSLIYDDIYLLVIVFLLILIFSYIMSQYLVRPLGTLQTRYFSLQQDVAGGMDAEETYRIDEVEQLRLSFNRLLDRIEQLVDERLRADHQRAMLELEKKATQIEALQAQISPHFLYNTLDNVMYFIEEGEQERSIELIGLLSRLFRYSMGKDSHLTTLREEVEYAKSYIRIMSLRYKDRIQCTWDTEESVMDNVVIKMLLQPLIENAIRHTMNTPTAHVLIFVQIQNVGGDLLISVSDDGPAMTEEKLFHIANRLESRDRKNVGLYNVNSRIKLHFGDDYGMEVSQATEGGAVFRLRLPLLEDKGNY